MVVVVDVRIRDVEVFHVKHLGEYVWVDVWDVANVAYVGLLVDCSLGSCVVVERCWKCFT